MTQNKNDIKAYLNAIIADTPEVLDIEQMPEVEVVQDEDEESDTVAWKLGNPKGPVGGPQVPPGNIHYGEDSWQNMQEDAANKAAASFAYNPVQAGLGSRAWSAVKRAVGVKPKPKPSRTQQAWSAIKNNKGKIAGTAGAATVVGGGYYLNKRRKARSNPVRSMFENQMQAAQQYEPARLQYTNPVQAEEDVNQVMNLFGTPNNIQAKKAPVPTGVMDKVKAGYSKFRNSSWDPFRKANPGDKSIKGFRELNKMLKDTGTRGTDAGKQRLKDYAKGLASENKGRLAVAGAGAAGAAGAGGYAYSKRKNKTKASLEERGLTFNDITAGELFATYDVNANNILACSQDAYINLVNASDYIFQTGDTSVLNQVLADVQDAIDMHENEADDLREQAEVEDGAAADAKEALADFHDEKAEDLAEGTEEILSALEYSGFIDRG